jgi:hypothetical protein
MVQESSLMTQLTRTLVSTPPTAPLADRLVAALSALLGTDGGSISIGFTPPDRTTMCVTDDVADRVEELQDVLREGPSLDAFRTREPVAATAVEQQARWPMLVRGLGGQHPGLRLLALPMSAGDDVLGVITLYQRSRRPLGLELAEAQFLANAIGVAIVGGFERSESTDLVWSTRDRVNQATGMVTAQLRIHPHDALALLRAHAYAHDATVAEVAELVVSRDLDFRDSGDERRSP